MCQFFEIFFGHTRQFSMMLLLMTFNLPIDLSYSCYCLELLVLSKWYHLTAFSEFVSVVQSVLYSVGVEQIVFTRRVSPARNTNFKGLRVFRSSVKVCLFVCWFVIDSYLNFSICFYLYHGVDKKCASWCYFKIRHDSLELFIQISNKIKSYVNNWNY